MRTTHVLTTAAALLVAVVAIPAGSTAASDDATLTTYISEIHYDNAGADTGEAVEVTGPAGTDLTGWSLVLYNGNGGAPYNTVVLSGSIPGTDVGAVDVSIAGIQNGSPDGVALVDDGDAVVQFISYEGSFTAVGGPADGLTSTDIGVSEPSSTAVGQSLQRDAAGAWFGPRPQSFGTPNDLPEPPPPATCDDPTIPIGEIQGEGPASPLVGVEVAIEGVVVGDFQTDPDGNSPLRGFNVQDAGDGDPATSDGIFVYGDAVPVSVGDRVQVIGQVSEYFGLTQISASAVVVCDTGAALPPPVELDLPVDDVDVFEAVEGMFVTFPQELVISEFFNFDRYGEIVLTSNRQFQPTAVFDPGSPEAAALAAANRLDRILLDDGRTNQNPDPAIHPNGAEFTLDNRFRGGDTLTDVTGVMGYAFGQYRIQPTQGATYTSVNERTTAPGDVGGKLTVASFNVLNYFNTLDDGGDDCGPSANLECRGADNVAERERQLDKIVAAIDAIDADVLGIIEVENTVGVEAMEDIVGGLNTIAGPGTYAYVDTGVIGTDAIKVGFIYQPASVTLVGEYAILDGSVDPRFVDTKNRPALAQTFMSTDTGGLVTVAVNHLKSKGSDCDDLDDPDLGDGAGNCNLTRTAAAEALVDWLAGDPTGSGSPNRLIIGDLNSYDKEDPIDAILAGGYTDLVAEFGGELAYSYVFDGQLGYLDHALASAELVDDVTGTTVWHINADEPDLIDYDTSFKKPAQDELYAADPYRSSDHDPVIVGLDVCDAIAPELDVSLDTSVLWPPNHRMVTVSALVAASDNFDDEVTVELVSVTSNEPDDGVGDGSTTGDIEIIDDATVELRAERSALGAGRVYTLTYSATDSCGNTTMATATVSVPLDRAGQNAARRVR